MRSAVHCSPHFLLASYNENEYQQVLTSISTLLVSIVQDNSLRHLPAQRGCIHPTQSPRTASSCFSEAHLK